MYTHTAVYVCSLCLCKSHEKRPLPNQHVIYVVGKAIEIKKRFMPGHYCYMPDYVFHVNNTIRTTNKNYGFLAGTAD